MKRIARTAKRASQTPQIRGARLSLRTAQARTVPAVRESLVRPLRRVTPHAPHVSVARSGWGLPSRLTAVVLLLFFIFSPAGDAFADTSDVVVVDIAPAPSGTEIQEVPVPEVVAEEPEYAPQVSVDNTAVPQDESSAIEDVEDTLQSEGDSVLETTSGENAAVAVSSETEPQTESGGAALGTEEITDAVDTSDTEQQISDEPTTEVDYDVEVDHASVASSSEPLSTTTPADIGTGTSTAETVVPVVGTTTDLIVPEVPPVLEEVVAPTSTATTSDAAFLPDMSTHSTDADRFTFGAAECVPVGNGAFHCVRVDEQHVAVDGDRGPLYAARDQEGDMEIYQNSDGSVLPITANDYDDDAPQMDPVTGDIVWQALIDDRTQIMHYDSETGAATKITKEAQNSMQPASNDGDIVFQSWIGNDWEIVLVDAVDGRSILTDNEEHDIAPTITNDYIMWQAMQGGEWVGRIMDRTSGEIETVRGIDGGKVENPRMIMVFDSRKDNGDTETVGYDPVSGEVVSLAVTPVPVPERIPAPEEQQEEKALIQPASTTVRTETKAGTSTDDGVDDLPLGDVGDGEGEGTASTTAPAVQETVDIPTTIDLSEGVADGAGEVVRAPHHIPDVVIPPFFSLDATDANTSPDAASTTNR